jgi:transcriptional regulator with GAF, ATPase, and Fis domain
MPWLRCEHTIRKSKKEYVLRKALTSIGRAPGNDLVLDDPMVAPSHASLMRSGAAWTLSAVDRTSDFYVNGRRTRSAELSPGDTVLVGAWQLSFLDGEPKPDAPAEGVGKGLSMKALEHLVDLSARIMRDTEPDKLFTALLEGVVEVTGAEKGFVIVFQNGQRQLAASHNVADETLDLQRVSDSIIDQVIQHLQPVIVSDAMHDSRFGRAQSVVDLRLSSVMCVPLIYRNDLLGVIYLGNDSVTDLFGADDLALLRIYASQAAMIVSHAMALNQLKVDNRNLRSQLRSASQGQLIGTSAKMKEVFRIVRRVSPTDLSVLVLGETGTGKELVAREIHNNSPRARGPFVAINCGAIPENLLESELFGHRKGSFTGAVADKVGKVEAASGGTLFLDEIGEMPMNLQVKLLRVLQERVIERIGDLSPRAIDVRVVAATHRDVTEMIQSGGFREDLYYRLNEITLSLPPLRDRGEDIGLLAKFFLNKYREIYENARPTGFTNQALTAMLGYYWPGNVRELENRIKKALIMSDRTLLNPDDLGLTDGGKRHVKPLAEAQEEFKLEYIRQVLELNNWNKAQTARDLGVDARTIFRYIERMEE